MLYGNVVEKEHNSHQLGITKRQRSGVTFAELDSVGQPCLFGVLTSDREHGRPNVEADRSMRPLTECCTGSVGEIPRRHLKHASRAAAIAEIERTTG